MRQLRRWADVSYRQLERNATDAGDVLPRATISAALGRDDLPREELLAAYVRACGGDDETVAAWLEARRRLSMTDPMAPPPVPEGAPATAAAQDDEDTPQETPRDLAAHAHEDQGAPDTGDGDQPAEETGSCDATPASHPAEQADPHPAGNPARATPAPSVWRRHNPQVAIAACAVAGVLALTFWPHDNHSDGNRADRAPTGVPSSGTTTSAPTSDRPSATAPGTGGETKDPGPSPTTEPVPPPADPPAGQEETTPSTDPTHARTATTARMPASGAARIHPASAPSRCLTEGRERNGRTDPIAVQRSCADSPLPRVTLEKLSQDVYRIRWYHPDPDKGLGCLTVDDASTSPGALLVPWDNCQANDSQKFRLEASTGGFRLRPLHSGLCIGFLPPVADGAEAIQTACTGDSDQAFTITTA
ncbi:hypothetical protein [Streptomyces sp. NPDC127100]|uniref:hypothetical protein n=1 Tax=Streptomyces sp. NPDC127100 TaxID=3347138 RepID=UPI003649D76F